MIIIVFFYLMTNRDGIPNLPHPQGHFVQHSDALAQPRHRQIIVQNTTVNRETLIDVSIDKLLDQLLIGRRRRIGVLILRPSWSSLMLQRYKKGTMKPAQLTATFPRQREDKRLLFYAGASPFSIGIDYPVEDFAINHGHGNGPIWTHNLHAEFRQLITWRRYIVSGNGTRSE